MKTTIENVINILIKRIIYDTPHDTALAFTQAVLNLANALVAISHFEDMNKI